MGLHARGSLVEPGCALLLASVAACAPVDATDSASDPVACTASGPLDDRLTLADVQALGTHNSYHIAPADPIDSSHRYTHPPLDVQADLGVRAFELDVHLGEDGVFQVFHLPVVDAGTTCATLADCLGVLRAWSDVNPCHTPLTIWVEPKDDLDAAVDGLVPLAGHLAELDAPLRAAWPDRLITPDDVRGTHPSLPDAIANGGPLLADSRGKLMATLLDSGEARAEYLTGAPALEGRALFVDSDRATDAFAATFKIDDAPGEAATVQALVAGNYLITSNVDSAADDAPTNVASFAAALAAGPHFLASDSVVAQEGSEYVAELPGGSPRCHPARVAEGCAAEALEP